MLFAAQAEKRAAERLDVAAPLAVRQHPPDALAVPNAMASVMAAIRHVVRELNDADGQRLVEIQAISLVK